MTYYVAFSGGADSTALAILLKEQGVKDIELVFYDTGAELPETHWTILNVAKKLGCELTVLSNGTWFQWFIAYHWSIPGFRQRWCTRTLKQMPATRYFADKEPAAIGIRADEPHRMSDYEPRPLVDAGMDKKDVIALCEKYDLLNPCYVWRRSCSCYLCQFQGLVEWKGLQREHPELFALAEHYEAMSIQHKSDNDFPNYCTFLKGKKTKDGRFVTLKDLREAQEDQLELFTEPTETACAICQW